MRCAQANLNNLLLSVVYLLVAGLQQRVWGARLAARLTVRCPGIMRCRHTCKGRLTGCLVNFPLSCQSCSYSRLSMAGRSYIYEKKQTPLNEVLLIWRWIRQVLGLQLAQSNADKAERRASQHRLVW